VNDSAKQRTADRKLEEFTWLKVEFLELVRRFNSIEDFAERRRLIRHARAVSHEAQSLSEQYRYELAERGKWLAEPQFGTVNENGTEQPKQKGSKSSNKIVPFRYARRAAR
jgi:hypothetical protein